VAEPGQSIEPKQVRVVFFGTGRFALPSFRRLLDDGYTIVLLVTQPEKPQGRRRQILPHEIRLEAERRGVPVYQPADVNAPESVARIAKAEPDLFVLAAYGQILSADLLKIPRLGSLNIHASLLPAYRGAAPVNWAIYHGESESGATIIEMTPRVDAGGIVLQRRVVIGPDETAGELLERLAALAAEMIPAAVRGYVTGELRPQPQPPGRYRKAPRLRKEHGRIDWQRSAEEIARQVRAFNPWPGCYTRVLRAGGKPVKLLVWRASVAAAEGSDAPPGTVVEVQPALLVQAGLGRVRLEEVQPESRRRMSAAEFVRGYRVAIGDRMSGDGPDQGA